MPLCRILIIPQPIIGVKAISITKKILANKAEKFDYSAFLFS